MKQAYSLMLCLLLATAAAAQNFRPFRPALTYQLSEAATPGDTTHLLRLNAGQAQGADSLFPFDPRTSRGRAAVGGCGRYVRRPDNLFGASLRVRPGAEYVLAAANGRTLTLRPRRALGQPWAATAAGLTAQVTARTLGTVLGQADSLATITFSDGAVLTLSKRFGWVSGPALGRYLNPRLPAALLTLTALPERGLGAARLGAFVVYDFQPGDVFLHRTTITGQVQPCSSPVVLWTRDSVLSRVLSGNGDTLRYQIRTRSLTNSRVCLGGGPALSLSTTRTLRIVRTTEGLDQPTGFWATSAASGPAGPVHLPASRTADYYGRSVQRHLGYLRCGATGADTTSLLDAGALDAGYRVSTAPGLGQTRVEYVSFTSELIELLGYRKGAETWGQLPTFAQLLPARAGRAAVAITAVPNPFGPALTVHLTLDRAQAVSAELRDALGRVVLHHPAQALGAGPQQLVLPTAALPAGLYVLHLRRAGEGRTEVLKVVKAE